MKNPHKPREPGRLAPPRMIFGEEPAHFTYFKAKRDDLKKIGPGGFEGYQYEISDNMRHWLDENVGEEWVDWAASVMIGGFPTDLAIIGLAVRNSSKFLLAMMYFGQDDVRLPKYP